MFGRAAAAVELVRLDGGSAKARPQDRISAGKATRRMGKYMAILGAIPLEEYRSLPVAKSNR